MYFFCFYVPETHCESVKQAVFAAGAGKIGQYDCCAWQIQGNGQYRPLAGSQPFQGQTNQVETVAEIKVEMVVAPEKIDSVLEAFVQAHPYETPAYHYWKVANES